MDNQTEKQKRQKGGFKSWLIRHKPSKRRLIQVYAALLYNANIKGFATGQIYTGGTKNLCVPGLNCYSCPGAVGACPLGALQNALASSKTSSLAYIFGILILFGLLLGRTICGFLCPFGLIQELLHKIPSPKLKKNKITRILSYFKYFILITLVVLVPLAFAAELAVPGFCKYVCPDGILFGAIGLLAHPDNAEMYGMLGPLFTWKFCLLILFITASIFIFRVFCRFFCPLGAIYGFFCRLALLGVKLDQDSCIHCGLCISTCKMDTHHVGDHECIHCGKCIPVCPTKAIRWNGSQFFVANPTAAISESAGTGTTTEQVAKEQAKKEKRLKIGLQITAAVLAASLLAFAVWFYNFRDTESKDYGYEVGQYCPDFSLSMIGNDAGETFTLSDMQGKIVVLNFWATWCTPCVNEIPHFEQLQDNYGDILSVLAIAEDTPKESYIAEKGWNSISFALDQSGAMADGSVYQVIGQGNSALPVTVVLDQEGKIIFRHVGSMSYDALLAAISPAMPQK